MYNLEEAFMSLDEVDDGVFSLDKSGIEKLKDYRDAYDETEETVKVIDVDAENEEEVKDSYVGDVILECSVCHAKIYKNKNEIVISDAEGEGEALANVGEECPSCWSTDGYKIIGKVCAFDCDCDKKNDDDKVDGEAEAEKSDEEKEIEECVENKVAEKALAKKATKGKILDAKTMKPLGESKQLNEGPGAGYFISGKISDVEVKSFVKTGEKQDEYSNLAIFKTDIKATLNDVEAESYYYSGSIKSAPISIYYVELGANETEDYTDADWKQYLIDALNKCAIKTVIGGGWSHTTFDGNIEAGEYDIKDGDDVAAVYFDMTDKEDVEYIDKAVTGDTIYDTYEVLDENSEFIEGFDDKDEAIKFAKENEEAFKVERVAFVEYRNGDSDPIGDTEVVWERDEEVKDECKEGLTKAERHNRAMNKIFDAQNAFIQKEKDCLIRNGVSKEDVEKMAQDVGLHGDPLAMKIKELGIECESLIKEEANDTLAKETVIKDWYKETYPTDDLGDELVDGFTFYDLFQTLDARKDVYKYLADDSLVRERVFEKLAEIMDVDYDYIYDQWLLTCDESFARNKKTENCTKIDESKNATQTVEEAKENKPITEDIKAEPMQIYMNTWANYNENGADLSKYGIDDLSSGWLSVEDAIEFKNKYAEDEPFINDTDNVPFDIGENDLWALEVLKDIEDNKDDPEIIAMIMEEGYDLKQAVEKYENGEYQYLDGVSNDEELGYAIIDEIGSIADAVSHPEYYIDEDAMKRNYEDDIRRVVEDDARTMIADEKGIDEDEVTDEDIEEYVDENLDSYLDSVVAEEIAMAERGEIDLSNYFDYEAFGRDCRFDGWSYINGNAILVEKLNVKKPKRCRRKRECRELSESMKKFIESKKTAKTDITESVDKATVEVEDNAVSVDNGESAVKVTEEADKVTVEVEKKSEETIAPLNDEEIAEIETASEENKAEENEEDEVDIEVDEFDNDSFDVIGEGYMKKVYENVNSYKTVSSKIDGNKIIVEGVITFKSGAKKKTSFVFESHDVTKSGKMRFFGENLQISKGKKSFTVCARADERKIVAESMSYNYRAGEGRRVFGTVHNR